MKLDFPDSSVVQIPRQSLTRVFPIRRSRTSVSHPSTLRFAMDQSKRFLQSGASARKPTSVMVQYFCLPHTASVLQPFCERLLPAEEIS